jgi:hypothetical protein
LVPKVEREFNERITSKYKRPGKFHKEEKAYREDRDTYYKESEYNMVLSRIRVKIENVLAKIKVFKILSDRYRKGRGRFNKRFKIIAGIVNLKSGFGFS